MLLHKKPGARTISKPDQRSRFQAFRSGEWLALLHDDLQDPAAPSTSTPNTPSQRATHARSLVQLGDAKPSCPALWHQARLTHVDTLPPGPGRRPNQAYGPLRSKLLVFESDTPATLPRPLFLNTLPSRSQGAAPGPSGLTAEALHILLDDELSTDLFVRVAASRKREFFQRSLRPLDLAAWLPCRSLMEGSGALWLAISFAAWCPAPSPNSTPLRTPIPGSMPIVAIRAPVSALSAPPPNSTVPEP